MTTVVTNGTLTVNPTVTTTYTVSTPSSGTCGAASQTISVGVRQVSISPVAPVVCANQPVLLTATYSGTAVNSYRWYNVANPSATLATTASYNVTNLTATTTYAVDVVSADCGSFTRQETVTVGGVTAATVAVTPSSASVCDGGAVSFVASSNNEATTYVWRVKGSNPVLSSIAALNIPRLNQTTTYELSYTTCGQTLTRDVVATVVTPNSSVSPSAVAICSGTRTTLSAVTNVSTAEFKWYVGNTSSSIISTSPSINVGPTANTTYVLQVLTSCGTTQYSSVVSVNPAVTATPSQTIARGTTVTLTASGSTNGAYSWTATSGGVTSPAGNSASIVVSPTTTTTYTVTGTNTAGCTTASSTVTVVAPLPVELISFDAAWNGKTPVLTWATATEKNSAFFDIERSFDGETFKAVGKHDAAGTTSARTNYKFVDASLGQTAAAVVYYRLRQVDVSGEMAYSPVRTLQVAATAKAFNAEVFPNPYDKTVAVQFTSLSNEAVSFIVRNVLGQTVLTKTVSAVAGSREEPLAEASALPLGMYYLTIRQGNQQQVLRLSHR
ncbi:Por secretion system C-terminal sorting domain-containing protein [Hymenobacter arizonensis]|uniref:Por secretion system C-terminal sorting domain-containing protein n=2 Tax=Hymenobacter arizonensis TaxID=1227077 RepID=A0A1I5WXW2_HYMAR|nr:T9SS type A sorting domain-containing protein [Hymenobacter arizonensis]SFQ24534.1 Por secretion system C-terminal sorting domain-containing protein [Hymenobacter arizonensis]